jgi:adenylate cyclase class 2
MRYEVEQKFPVGDPQSVCDRLVQLGAALSSPVLQVDEYFAHPCRDFAQSDEALRIRRVGESNYLTYKGPKVDAVTKTRRELELPLAAGDEGYQQFKELLLALGFAPVACVRKQRRITRVAWRGQHILVALDDVDSLGTFVELELAADDSTLAAARQAIADLASNLGLHASQRRSYLELLLAKRS